MTTTSRTEMLAQLENIERGLSMLKRMAAKVAIGIRKTELEAAQEGETLKSKVEIITRLVAAEFGVTYSDVMGRGKEAPMAAARQVSMWLAKELTPLSCSAIARHFGRDHATVLYAIERVAEMRDAVKGFDDRMLRLVAKVEETLSAKNERKP